MLEKLAHLWPEIFMLVGAVACLFIGLSGKIAWRQSTIYVALATLVVTGFAVVVGGSSGESPSNVVDGSNTAFASFVKLAVVGVGVLLLMVIGRVPDRLAATRDSEKEISFEPGHAVRGEFLAFFLVSLAGVMLCGGAGDLVWLFLALELTSLPTYVMIAISRDKLSAQEAAVKYFFLGALAVAIFLYGFALIYGATGFTEFSEIQGYVAERMKSGAGLPPLLTLGVILAVVGIAFKIAAAPMQFYAADVYEGAATPVTAFLAFVPKTAGFVSLILITRLVALPDGSLPQPITITIWVMAAVTMTYGNVLGLLQNNLKRMLAYSSVAHSGYMLVGLLAGAGAGGDALSNGYAAILFYLVAYGIGNLGAFAVLAMLEQKGEEAQTIDDVRGLATNHPGLAAVMMISMLSLVGLPPMVGFVGKIFLFGAAINAGHIALVIIAVLNSAISAVYYLRVTAACYFDPSAPDTTVVKSTGRRNAAMLAAIGSLIIGVTAGWLADATLDAAKGLPVAPETKQAADADKSALQQGVKIGAE